MKTGHVHGNDAPVRTQISLSPSLVEKDIASEQDLQKAEAPDNQSPDCELAADITPVGISITEEHDAEKATVIASEVRVASDEALTTSGDEQSDATFDTHRAISNEVLTTTPEAPKNHWRKSPGP